MLRTIASKVAGHCNSPHQITPLPATSVNCSGSEHNLVVSEGDLRDPVDWQGTWVNQEWRRKGAGFIMAGKMFMQMAKYAIWADSPVAWLQPYELNLFAAQLHTGLHLPVSLDFPTEGKQMWTICRLCALQYISSEEQSRPGLHRPAWDTVLSTDRAQVLGAGLWDPPEAFLLSCMHSPKSYQDEFNILN